VWGISLVGEQPLASQEEFCSMKLVMDLDKFELIFKKI
jgi:hypothetical protein